MVEETLPDPSPADVQTARDTLVELTTAVTHHSFDDIDTRLAPALAQAAKNLAEERLADVDLSPAMPARELNVSVRTLQRAFAAGGESAIAYIRERRLESARQALLASRLTVSEISPHRQFADGSHFIRAFKQRYELAPAEFVRKSTSSEAGRRRVCRVVTIAGTSS
ncbi:helix-turn-helix transcriptional regulator [Streptomyces sp. NPDC002911]